MTPCYRRAMNESTDNTPPVPPAAEPKPAPEAPAVAPLIGIEDFAKVELKVGQVVECMPHPSADKLLVMKVDLGEAAPRQIVAGIRADWSPADLIGKQLIICANLKPAKLRGIESQGMMLAVRGTSRVWPLTIEGPAAPGTRVT